MTPNLKKILIIGLAVLVSVGIAIFLLSRFAGHAPVKIVSKKMALRTSSGTVITNDLQAAAARYDSNPYEYYIDEQPNFWISMFKSGYGFTIVLMTKPLSTAQLQAETAFLKDLGISKTDACKLNVTEAIPLGVDSGLAGQNLGLSFCPGAVPLH